jgi:asparagine synthase (glutamine-hydrolysing)
MCGIAGIVRPKAGPDEIAAGLDRMLPGIASRGPDGTGRMVGAGVGLLNTRLAIIDLAGGDQPVWGEDRAVGCVFNGEIYNYLALRQALRQRGHVLTTEGDTEVLVHLYEDHGPDLVHHIHGMYAFAVYDSRRQQVLLGRDRFGQKPLYLAPAPGGGIAFASSIASLLALGVSRDPDPAGLAQYFRFYKVPEPRTAYRDISTLLPGHTLAIDVATADSRAQRFYRPGGRDGARVEEASGVEHGDGADAVARARSALEAAVATHVVAADVEVGAFLSGGVDSSLVVAQAQRVAQRPLRTFSVTFAGEGAAYDESPYAEAVARQIGTRHQTIRVDAPPAALIRHALDAAHQPFAVASFLPLLLLSEHVSRELKVVLTGDGGDEIGFGYPWYRWMAWAHGRPSGFASRTADALLGPVERRLSGHAQLRRLRRAAKFARGAVQGGAAAADTWRYDLGGAEAAALLAPEHRSGSSKEASPNEVAWRHDLPGVDALRQADLEVLLRDEMLPKLDRAGMAHGLEGRAPLLDDEFTDAMLAVPRRLHVGDGRGKVLLRRWAGEAVPGIDFDRPKHGFDVPIDRWLRSSLRSDVDRLLLDPARRGLVDRAAARSVWRRMEGGVPGAGHTIYALLMAELWFEAQA